MASVSPSSSPQWDSRNRGFIPPSQLQQMRRDSPVNRELHAPAPEPPPTLRAAPPARPPPAPSSGHSRSSSFFSFLSKSHDSSQPSSPSSTQQSRRLPDELGRASVDMSRPSLSSPLAPARDGALDSTPQRRASIATETPPGGPPPLHPEIRSVVQLTLAHVHKVYFSGPLVRRIERHPDGHQPAKDEGWRDVWAQLGGTTLSVWDMKEIEEASKVGKEVPPTYINITDAFVNVLGAVTIPASGTSPAKKYSNVVTVNSAGSNLLLFSCPSTIALISWATAFRLAAWEKSRLEEIYTAHLIRITFDGREIPTPLVRHRMEGWVRLRMAGQTDWKRLWMVVSSGSSPEALSPSSAEHHPGAPEAPRNKRRLSNLFSSREEHPDQMPISRSIVSFYSSHKPKDRKRPFLTFQDVSQAFAVYPERPELITRSTLMKLEGTFGDEEVAGGMRGREGWILVMPELEHGLNQATEMLKWLIGLHDAFQLYGRPKEHSWDPRDPASMMFAYPVGPHRDNLFLEREAAETMDPRDDRTSAVRSRLLNILLDRMQGLPPRRSAGAHSSMPPTLPPLHSSDSERGTGGGNASNTSGSTPQLPPFSFGSSEPPRDPAKRILTPITEGSQASPEYRQTEQTRSLSLGGDGTVRPPLRPAILSPPEERRTDGPVLDGPVNVSPTSFSQQQSSPGLRNEGSPNTSFSRPSPKPNQSFSRSVSNAMISTDDHSNPANTSNVPSTASIKTNNSSFATSPPPLSPTTSSNPPASISAAPPPRTPSPKYSILTSPHSMLDSPIRGPGEYRAFVDNSERTAATRLPATPPMSPRGPLPPSKLSSPAIAPEPEHEDTSDLFQEAGALYYMQQFEQETPRHVPPQPTSEEEDEEEDNTSDEEEVKAPPPSVATKAVSPLRPRANSPAVQPAGTRSPPAAAGQWTRSPPVPHPKSPTLEHGSDRRPIGARAAPSSNRHDSSLSLPVRSPDPYSSREDASDIHRRQEMSSHLEDPDADALAALTFLEQDEHVDPSAPSASQLASSPPPPPSQAPPSVVVEPEDRSSSPGSDAQYKSSFAPSRTAMERKAKSEAQQAAHEAATHRPGRAAGKARVKAKSHGAWGDSSDEEEEEEEEEEDVDSDGEPTAPVRDNRSPSGSMQPGQPGAPYPSTSSGDSSYPPSQVRGPRTLPQVPGSRSQEYDSEDPQQRRFPDQYSERRTFYEDSVRPSTGGTSGIPTHAPAPVPSRHMWSQVLDPGRAPGSVPENINNRDTFVQLDSPAQTLTKAFTPHGLLSVGLQDKQDRSAKKQEELARESGASLVNVPNKPPPPQTGLLGAITAHERDRKREGGVGATLTEREREKRLAEERQRKLDDYQRQQLEQMAQGGSMYGGQQFPGYNPMMNPMMMGMNPMMSGYMGYPGMMPAFANPQHMYAAQQAAQAYQQTMMALSQAGSQVGGEGGGGGTPAPLNPMMTGASMGGFDPRFSMMMPMMSPMPMGGMGPMGSGMGMGGMGGGMGGMAPGGMAPMGMQMTGGSAFDPRFSQFDPGLALQPPSADFANQGRFSPHNSSAGRDSPRRTGEGGDEPPRRSANASPRPPQ
ncbi:hypothetical protein BV25DRAFT_162900 [Artomyces pyxidatus]|uniref:Uncharacterized protein n=1 Tax=Artomyces pyxidatus TaxID=48021 RepID=A0ACB8T923_9AGAM|nr:hypothetical protein BV25DRAFT_162900 [Artomyces pyxidatus]